LTHTVGEESPYFNRNPLSSHRICEIGAILKYFKIFQNLTQSIGLSSVSVFLSLHYDKITSLKMLSFEYVANLNLLRICRLSVFLRVLWKSVGQNAVFVYLYFVK